MFRSPVFNASETFVRAQATGLVRYQPLVVGLEPKGHVPAALAERLLLPGGNRRLAIRLAGQWGGFGEEVRRTGPVLVHAHFGPDGVLALPLARALDIPLVTSLRGYDVGRSPSDLLASGRLSWVRYALRRRRLAQEGDLFLAVSEALRSQAIDLGYPSDRTLTHYNGVDLDLFRPGSQGGDGTILHVGRLVEKKGTAVLLRACAAVRPEFPGSRLVIIGDGRLRGALERLAGELGLGESVQFLGEQPPATVAEWMRRADLLAAPSLTAAGGDAEGLPNTVVEAAASGLPVIGSDHQGIPEAVVGGSNGFLVSEGEVEPLARRLADLLGDGELRRRMGAAGRALAEEKFGSVRQMALLEERYDQVRADFQRTATRAIETR